MHSSISVIPEAEYCPRNFYYDPYPAFLPSDRASPRVTEMDKTSPSRTCKTSRVWQENNQHNKNGRHEAWMS